MIKRIVEADNEAKALEESNQKAAEKERQRIEQQAQAIYQQYMDDAETEIAKDATYVEKLFERKLADTTAKQESVLIKLRADFEQNRDKWVDEIVSRVID
ncbi:hypothetical protein [Ruminococcus sp.]|uniref:hypothetical protein n=1 Tax=Ruminococcus sp. TaxID=41978 RepID=UPI00388FC531